ncbi:NUMOD4 domain-containing protein [uncultured Duncaniella sp.]|uniref:NUMOD4 domain-containing protein n=1 Tax=uncultured Duncaniella sp. TaxID=2768039 RepID=UPI00262FED5D|nr:NUMOD4 domain-containing protein [uncultured Duncaniella sp.]
MIPEILEYYKVSNLGRVYNRFTGRLIAPELRKGYPGVSLCIKPEYQAQNGGRLIRTYSIHRLVMLAHSPMVLDYSANQVNHMDGVTTHSYLMNLEWCSPQYNTQHAYRTGLAKSGEDSYRATITEQQAIQIMDLLDAGVKPTKIARQMNVSVPTVAGIKAGLSWKKQSEGRPFLNVNMARLPEEQLHKLCAYYRDAKLSGSTKSDSALAREALAYYGYPSDRNMEDRVRAMYNGRSYQNIASLYGISPRFND